MSNYLVLPLVCFAPNLYAKFHAKYAGILCLLYMIIIGMKFPLRTVLSAKNSKSRRRGPEYLCVSAVRIQNEWLYFMLTVFSYICKLTRVTQTKRILWDTLD